MQEFLDLRTLSINNILMSLSFAGCLLIYSTYHSQFRGIKPIAYGFFISSSAFLLMGLRNYVPDFLSILLPNLLLVLSMAFIHVGFVYFYQFEARVIKLFHATMLLAMAMLATYFTYIENNVNARIVIISFFLAFQCLYIVGTLLRVHNKANFTIVACYLLFIIFFVVRGVLTLSADPLYDFMNAGLIHSLSIVFYELLVAITSFGMVWIVSLRVQGILMEQASHDPLTKVLNRRALENIIDLEHSRSLRDSIPLSVIMLDIDHFKRINDRYGHARGDEILVDIANVLINNTRPYDSVARFGGEEFIILLPNTSIDKAKIIAEHLRLKIENHDYNFNENDAVEVTASFGATECDLVKDGWLQILKRVDSGLYHAKAAGRNRVIVYNTNNPDADLFGAR